MNKYLENNRRYAIGFSIVGSMVIIAFLLITNYLTSWSSPWFIYPSFAVIWWPLSVSLMRPHTAKAYSLIGSLIILAFLAADNFINSPSYPWVPFAIFPVLLWPICVFLGKRAYEPLAALGLSAIGIVYYIVLNMLIYTGFPWAIFPAYVLLWWPLSVGLAKRGHAMSFSICGTLLSAAFFIITNVITTPHTVWAAYPIFALAWWPLATYYFVYKRHRSSTKRRLIIFRGHNMMNMRRK